MNYMMEHPFWPSVGIIFVLFGLAHVVLSRIYRLGARATLVAGVVCGIIVIGLMYYGISTTNAYYAGLSGIVAGIVMWSLFGEIAETLKAKFGVNTHVEVGYGQLPILILAGVIWIFILKTNAITHPAVFQFLMTFYAVWLGHVILLSLYYNPLLGLPLSGHDQPGPTIWSGLRRVFTALTLVVYAVIIGLMAGYINRYQIPIQLSAALWFVLLGWSFIEVAKKAFHLKLW